MEITTAVAEAILRRARPGARVEDVVTLTGGESNAVYEVRCAAPDPSLILKVYGDAVRWKMRKELFVYDLLARRGEVPVAAIVLADSSKEILPESYVVMTKVEGKALSAVTPRLAAGELGEVYRQMGVMLRALHRVTFDGFGSIVTEVIDPLPSNERYMTARFQAKLSEYLTLGGDAALHGSVERYAAARAGLLAGCSTAVLCHNDFHEGNVLVVQDQGRWRVAGVIDMENALAGDPLLDIAKTDAYSIRGHAAKMEGLIEGYGALPVDGAETAALYRLFHALELWNWFAIIGRTDALAGLAADMRRICAG